MTTTELNNRKYTLIKEITCLESEDVIEKIERLISKETLHKKLLHKKSPISFTEEELKLEIEEAEKETDLYTNEEVKAMSWKK